MAQGVGEKVSCLLGWELGWWPPVGEQEWGEVTTHGRALGTLSLSIGQVTACILAQEGSLSPGLPVLTSSQVQEDPSLPAASPHHAGAGPSNSLLPGPQDPLRGGLFS